MLGDLELMVRAAVVHLECKAYEPGQDRARSRVRADRYLLFLCLLDWERHDEWHLPRRALEYGRRGSHLVGGWSLNSAG